MRSPTPAPPPLWLRTSLVVAIVCYAASALAHVFCGALNTDEGFYAVATRAVAQGEMPYRDFGFTQTPGVLYANALPLKLIGFGLFPQRLLNGIWAAAALAGAGWWLARRVHPTLAVAIAVCFATTAPWLYFIHLGKTYGFTAFLATAAALVFLELRAGARRNFILGALAVLGTATRLPAAPFFGVLWLLALWPGRRPTRAEIGAALAGPAVAAVLAILPFAWIAPEQAWFWVFQFHRVSVPLKGWEVSWAEIAALAPALWILAGTAFLVALRQGRQPSRPTGLLLASLITLAANLFPAGTYEEYGVPFLVPLALAALAIVSTPLREAPRWARLVFVALLAGAQAVTAPLLFWNSQPERRGTPSAWLTYGAPVYNPALYGQLAVGREILREVLPLDSPFVGAHLILATETGHDVPAKLRMGPFTFTNEMSEARARLLHLATRDDLRRWYTDPKVTAIAHLSAPQLNHMWSMPSFSWEPESERRPLHQLLYRDFEIGYREGTFLILVRRGSAPSPAPAK